METVYSIRTPSLDGVLSHSDLMYEGIQRPDEILRAFDSGVRTYRRSNQKEDQEVLERYFFDIYGVFLKKFSSFAISDYSSAEETVKLQALFQEMINVKKTLAKLSRVQNG